MNREIKKSPENFTENSLETENKYSKHMPVRQDPSCPGC